MSRRPRFKRHFHCEIVPSEGVFLLSEDGYFLLRGRAYIQLAPFLNGNYTEYEIVESLQGQFSASEVHYVLNLLRQKGYVVDAVSSIPSPQAAFWDSLSTNPKRAYERLQNTTVSILSFGEIDPTPFKTLLELQGIRVASEGHDIRASQLQIVLTDDYLRDGLQALNQDALAHHQAWLLLKPVGTQPWIGPLFVPHKTGCWNCLEHRLRGHRKVERYLQGKKGLSNLSVPPQVALPSTQQTAFSIAATELTKWIVNGQNQALEGQVMTLNLLSLEKQSHILVRRPQCPSCGEPNTLTQKQFAPVVLQRQPKSFTTDGGHRTLSPEETFKRFEHHISPITGIVGHLRQVTVGNEKELTTSYVADHNFVLVHDDLYFLRESLRGRSGGKGKNDLQAKVSGLCESIERYSGVFQGNEARIQAKFSQLDHKAIHPNDCMLFSQRQYATREMWNSRESRFNWVPEPFDEEMTIDWSPLWSLTYKQRRYLPTAYCYYGYSRQYNTWFARADANGCAAGNSKEGAILQAFMELVERDSVALWWYNRLKKPAVLLASFDDPYIHRLQAYYKSLQRDLWVLDITSDLNIPAFAAISRRHDQAREDIMFGFGAHFDPQIALLRALTELNQVMPSVFHGTTNKQTRDQDALDWWNTATIAKQRYLTPDEKVPAKNLSDYPKQWSDDLYHDVMSCVEIAKGKGLETLVLDQTRPDTGLHVVKVVVPGLRHFWARYAPGRLYDVPVKMGWLSAALHEEELNPKLMFL